MTKIRSGDSSMIDDRRGSGGGGGRSAASAGFPIPIKAGGGLLGRDRAARLAAAAEVARAAASPRPASRSGSGKSADAGRRHVQQRARADRLRRDRRRADVLAGRTCRRSTARPTRSTKTVFFTDATNTGCGQASSQTGPFYCPVDHLVYIDLELHAGSSRQQFIGKPSDLAEQYIVAHEYGHHIQNLVGINDQVQQAQQNDPGRANQYSVALELQADCFAGMWVGDAASARAARQRRARSTRRSTPPPASATTASSRRRRAASTRRRGPTAPPSSARRGSRAATTRATRSSATRSARCCDRLVRLAAAATPASVAATEPAVDPLDRPDAEAVLPQRRGNDGDHPETGGEGEGDIEAGRADQVPTVDEQR